LRFEVFTTTTMKITALLDVTGTLHPEDEGFVFL
jgi:hypothetical protein